VETDVLFNIAVRCKSCIAFRDMWMKYEHDALMEWYWHLTQAWNHVFMETMCFSWSFVTKCLCLPTKLFLFLHSILTVIFVWIFSIRSAAFYCKGWYNCTGQPWGEESDASRSVQASGYGFRQQVTRSGPLAH